MVAALGLLLHRPPHPPARKRRNSTDAKLAAQDDLIALSTGLTDHDADVAIRSNPEAAEEQAAALSAYERGTAALDAARRPGTWARSAGPSPRASTTWPAPRPSRPTSPGPSGARRASSTRGTACRCAMPTGRPPDGGPGREVPVCSGLRAQARAGHRARDAQGGGRRRAGSSYVNAGFAPAYWGGFGLGPGLFTGFLLGQALRPHAFFGGGYPGDGDPGGGDFGGGDFGGGDFGGGDFGGGDF